MNYNDSNIECSYIQNLLESVYIPTIRVLKNQESAKDGEIFICKNIIYKKDAQSFNYINQYNCGKEYQCITKNHISESNFYNSNLHIALGEYLRFQRDYYGMDLMPLYNCFSNIFIDRWSLPISDVQSKQTGSPIKNNNYKLFTFPVKHGKSYSIYCKGACTATVQLGYFNGKSLLTIVDSNNNSLRYEASSLLCSENNPGIFNVVEADSLQKIQNEGYLYLFVQLPNENANNIVIIENNSAVVINNSLIENKQQIPFSDKLIGYLLDYYITPKTTIQQNIADIQNKLYNISLGTENVFKNYSQGVFDNTTKEFIYNKYRFNNISDFTGYVDRDVEDLINKEYNKIMSGK